MLLVSTALNGTPFAVPQESLRGVGGRGRELSTGSVAGVASSPAVSRGTPGKWQAGAETFAGRVYSHVSSHYDGAGQKWA